MKKAKMLVVVLVALLMVGGLFLAGCAVVGCPSGRPNTSGYCSYYTNCGGSSFNGYYCDEYYTLSYTCDC